VRVRVLRRLGSHTHLMGRTKQLMTPRVALTFIPASLIAARVACARVSADQLLALTGRAVEKCRPIGKGATRRSPLTESAR